MAGRHPQPYRDIDVSRFGAGAGRPTLLELGCGGGHLLSHLTAHFTTEAVDLSAQMLDISRRLNPQTLHHQGDMRTIRLGRTFDVVAIHDAVNYMITEADLQAAIATVAAHLNPGGLALLAPDCVRETYTGPRVVEWTRDAEDRSITFIEYMGQPQPALAAPESATLESAGPESAGPESGAPESVTVESVFFFIIDTGGELRVEVDRHTGGLFHRATWLRLLAEAGLTAEYIRTNAYEGGFGGNLFVGRKPPAG